MEFHRIVKLDLMTKVLLGAIMATGIVVIATVLWISASQPAKAEPSGEVAFQDVHEPACDGYMEAGSFSYETPVADEDGTVSQAHAHIAIESRSLASEGFSESIGFSLLADDGTQLARTFAEIPFETDETSTIVEIAIPSDLAARVVTVSATLPTGRCLAWREGEPLPSQIASETEAWAAAKGALELSWQEQQSAIARIRDAALASASNVPTYAGTGEYGDTLMVGDSIMVVSSWSLKETLPGITIDAVSGRSLEYGGPGEGGGCGDGVLDHVRACDRSFARYVIGTGNNDGAGMDLDAAEEIVSLLPGKQIWFVTEYVSNNSQGTANTNSTIDAMAAKYPNVHKADWNGVVVANAAAFLQGDNCHPQTRQATDAYAVVVKDALASTRQDVQGKL